MKVYTDAGNIQTVKLLAAANAAGVMVEVVVVKHDEPVIPYLSTNRLPALEVIPGKFLFTPNAALRYLMSLGGKTISDTDEDEWLEWDSTQLVPTVWPLIVNAVCHNKVETTLQNSAEPLLHHLNKKLHGKSFLFGHEISAADIAVFCSLYPLLITPILQEFMGLFPAVMNWGRCVLAQPPVAHGIKFVTVDQGLSSLKNSLLVHPGYPPVHVQTKKLKSAMTTRIAEDHGKESTEDSMSIITPLELSQAVSAWENGSQTCAKPRIRKHPILPQDGERNLLITSALPYVNNVPHLGNIIGCVLSADVFSRYCRLRNYNVLYVSGTDEYGTATETKAIEEGVTPLEICTKYNKLHNEVYEWLNIDFDYFGRTSTPQQTEIAQDIFWKLYNRGFVLKDTVDQLLCEKCNRFLADRFVHGECPICGYDDARGDQCDACGKLINAVELKNPKCKSCETSPVVKTSHHLFLDLPKAESDLRRHLDGAFASGTWTTNAKMITNAWIRDGLKPRCISRDLKWGTPVPLEGYTDKVFYVWFDAPIGYISITANYTDQWRQWWKNPSKVEMYNFLGKDNVPFHSVIFPSTLLCADDNYTIVNHMLATEYLNYEDTKFSKSRGVGVFGDQARSTGIPADIYRFYLLYVRPETQDTSFSWDDFLLKNNSELLNNLGNFVNRALSFLANNFSGVIQEMTLTTEDDKLLVLINRELKTYIDNMEVAKLRDSIRNILNISRLGNQFMQANKPWVLVKGNKEERARAGSVVSLSGNISQLLSVLLQPYMPDTSAMIQTQLNSPTDCNVIHDKFICVLKPGHSIGKPSPLFEKIEASTMSDLKSRFAGKGDPEPVKRAKHHGKAQADSPAVVNGPAKPEDIERLTAEVTKQGMSVRELKTNKAEKSAIDAAVAILLDLKRQLAVAQGDDPSAVSGSGKKKGKKK
ncbi:methionine--tRNA ligase, cytoplasmic-like [Gigantopelta aegis]|uniref:methionine--tRNA ligase, cytoplasmic-like n=1 Tax=Gigantopelta aegis TaxID=1735272 RepID=UPI001B88D014|nr:methionine--tRNA ligase, cytoplasmic-like [Gigantopelta aegis]